MAATDSPPPKKPLGIPRPSGARNSMTITLSVGKALADVMNNPASNPTATVPAKGKESKRLSLTNTFKKAIPAPIATAPAKSGKKSPQPQPAALPSPPSSSPTFGRRTANPPAGVSPIKPKSTTTPNGPVTSALPKFRPKTSGIISGSKPSAFSPSRRKRRGSSDEDADQSASATDVSLNARPVSPLPRRGVARASLLGTVVAAEASQTKTVPPIVTVIPPSSVPPASNSPIKPVEPKKRKTAVPQPSTSSSARSSPLSGLPLKPGTPSTSRPVSAASRTRSHSSASNQTSTSTRKPVTSPSAKGKENQTRSSPVVTRTLGTSQGEKRAAPRTPTPNKAGPSAPNKLPTSSANVTVGTARKPSTVQEEPPQTEDAPDYPDTSMESIDVGEVSALLDIDRMPSPVKTFPRTGPGRLRPGAAYGNIGFGSPQTPPRNLPARSQLSYLSPSAPHPDDMSPSPSLRANVIEVDRRSRTSILSWEQFSHSRISTSGLDMLSNVPVPFHASTPGMTPLMTPDDEDSTLRLPGLPRQRVDSGWGPESPVPFLNNLSLSRSSSPPLPASRRTSGRPSLPRSHISSVAEDSPSIGQIMFPPSEQPTPLTLSRRSPPRAPATPPTEDDTAGALVALLRLQLASAEDRAHRSELENKLLSDELANRMHAEEERREALEAEMEAELNGIRQAMEEEKHESERALEGLAMEVQNRTRAEEVLKAALESAERAIEEKERQARLEQEQRMDSAEHRRIVTELRRKHDMELAMREADEAYRTARLAIEQELELVSLWQEMTSVLGDSLAGAATIISGQLPISV